MNAIRKWARDPLFHFLIAGAALFAFFAWRGTGVDPESRSIEVTREVQASLAWQFERAFQRAPTDAELDGLVNRWVRDEVLYREALRLGLEGDDAVIRRRLAQKMDGIAGAEAETEIPSDATLEQWLADNPERFATQVRVSFDQLLFPSRDKLMGVFPTGLGDDELARLAENTALPGTLQDVTLREVKTRFGELFVEDMLKQRADGGWAAPVRSSYGWHMVRIRHIAAGDVPELSEIRDRVENDWRTETIAERRERAYEVLRSAYRVHVEE